MSEIRFFLDLLALIPRAIALFVVARNLSAGSNIAVFSLRNALLTSVVTVALDLIRVAFQIQLLAPLVIISSALMLLQVGVSATSLNIKPPTRTVRGFLAFLLWRRGQTAFKLFTGLLSASILIGVVSLASSGTDWMSGVAFSRESIPLHLLVAASYMTIILAYLTGSFLRAVNRVQDPAVRRSLLLFLVSWSGIPVSSAIFFETYSGPLVDSLQAALLSTSIFYLLIAFGVPGYVMSTRTFAGSMVEDVVFTLGKPLLVLHDGEESSARILARSVGKHLQKGPKVSFTGPFSNQILKSLHAQPDFDKWSTAGRIGSLDGGATGEKDLRATMKPSELSGHPQIFIEDSSAGDLESLLSENLQSEQHRSEETRLFLLDCGQIDKQKLDAILKKFPSIQFLDLAESKNSFSRLLNSTHEALEGKKILLLLNGAAEYVSFTKDFVRESGVHGETSILVTRQVCPLAQSLRDMRRLKMIAYSTTTSIPSEVSEKEILVPEGQTGMLTGILHNVVRDSNGKSLALVLDEVTGLFNDRSFNETYRTIMGILEVSALPSIKTLIIANSAGMDQKQIAALRNLFSLVVELNGRDIKLVQGELKSANANR